MHDPVKEPEKNTGNDFEFRTHLLFKEKPSKLKRLELDKAIDYKMRGLDLEFEEDKKAYVKGFFTYSCIRLVNVNEPFCPLEDGVEVLSAWFRATGADFAFFHFNWVKYISFGMHGIYKEALICNLASKTLLEFVENFIRRCEEEDKKLEGVALSADELDKLMKM